MNLNADDDHSTHPTLTELSPLDLRYLLCSSIQKGLLFRIPLPSDDKSAIITHLKQTLPSTLNFFPPLIGRFIVVQHHDNDNSYSIKSTIEKTKRRFDNYGKQGLLCLADGLPHLIMNRDQRHCGEFTTPGILFLYIAGWIMWVGQSYLIAIRDDKKPTRKEIIIDVPLAPGWCSDDSVGMSLQRVLEGVGKRKRRTRRRFW